jgi:ketosteroid isomerase-like protein
MNNHDIEQILVLTKRINQAWTTGNVDDMVDCLDESIIMVGPGFSAREQGRDYCIQGYGEFTNRTTIVEFDEYDHQVDVIGDTAVVVYDFVLVYVDKDARHRSTGKDLWVLKKNDTQWQAVWRTILDVTDNIV